MSKFFSVSWLEVKEAIAVGIVTFLIVIITEIIYAGSIWGLDWKTLVNDGTIAGLSVIGTFLKSLLTTSTGKLAGVKIK